MRPSPSKSRKTILRSEHEREVTSPPASIPFDIPIIAQPINGFLDDGDTTLLVLFDLPVTASGVVGEERLLTTVDGVEWKNDTSSWMQIGPNQLLIPVSKPAPAVPNNTQQYTNTPATVFDDATGLPVAPWSGVPAESL